MPRIGDVTGDDLKGQQDEYYLLVAEVIGGITADLTDQQNRLSKAENKILHLYEQLENVGRQNILLAKELLALRSNQ
jgi:hypothetical protein